MFEDLIGKVLGGLPFQLKDKLLGELENAVESIVTDTVSKSCSRTILKGIDGVVAASVKSLTNTDAQALIDAYMIEIREQVLQFANAITVYVPLQVAVETAKKEHGTNSVQAKEARTAREAGIKEFREEFQDILRVVVGDDPKD
jgi:hypothetical protein